MGLVTLVGCNCWNFVCGQQFIEADTGSSDRLSGGDTTNALMNFAANQKLTSSNLRVSASSAATVHCEQWGMRRPSILYRRTNRDYALRLLQEISACSTVAGD